MAIHCLLARLITAHVPGFSFSFTMQVGFSIRLLVRLLTFGLGEKQQNEQKYGDSLPFPFYLGPEGA